MGYGGRRASDRDGCVATRVKTRQHGELRAWCWMGFGMLAVLAAFGLYMLDLLDYIISWQTTLMPGTIAYSLWGHKMEMIQLRVYIFNVTNPEQFLEGSEDLHVEEVGPFVYKEVLTFTNMSLGEDKASFRAHRHLEFVPEDSIGDPADVHLILPNIALLAAATFLSNSGMIANLGLRSLAGYLGSKTLIPLSVEELLWGYDDPFISLAHTVVPSFVDFRRLGLLDRVYTPAEDDIVMRTGFNSGADPTSDVLTGTYSIDTFNGATGYPEWGHGVQPRRDPHTGASLPPELPCDTVRGSFEGLLFPRHIVPGQKIYIFRRQFCRPMPIINTGEGVTDEGYRYLVYHAYLRGLFDTNDPESLCYCADSAGIDGACLPNGFSSTAPCSYGMSLALSLPHFLFTNGSTISRVVGMNPSVERHDSFSHIQQDVGVALKLVCRLQLNIMVGATRMAMTKRFNNMAVPILWIDLNYDVPDDTRSLLRLALVTGPILQATVLTALALGGVGAAVRGWLLRRRLLSARRGSADAHLQPYLTPLCAPALPPQRAASPLPADRSLGTCLSEE